MRSLSFILLLIIVCLSCQQKKHAEQRLYPEYNAELLQRVRQAAFTMPGSLPTSINYTKFGESRRKCSDLIEGESDVTCVMARTVFQVVYPDGWIMIDAGMDRQVHQFFEKDGPQPFDQAKAAEVQEAVSKAKLIVVTHEHGDHVAGVIHRKDVDSVNFKTILTTEQADALIHDPQMPEIELKEEQSKRYLITDFTDIIPVAPGIVLIKAPGHTKGEIIVYVKTENKHEYLFVGDITWSFAGVTQQKLKSASERKRLAEDSVQIKKQLAWINNLATREKLTVLVSHDERSLKQFVTQGFINEALSLSFNSSSARIE